MPGDDAFVEEEAFCPVSDTDVDGGNVVEVKSGVLKGQS